MSPRPAGNSTWVFSEVSLKQMQKQTETRVRPSPNPSGLNGTPRPLHLRALGLEYSSLHASAQSRATYADVDGNDTSPLARAEGHVALVDWLNAHRGAGDAVAACHSGSPEFQ